MSLRRGRLSRSTSARCSAGASCYSIMPTVSNSPLSATCARPASPTCSSPSWAISRAIRRHKEQRNEYSIERHAPESPLGSQGTAPAACRRLGFFTGRCAANCGSTVPFTIAPLAFAGVFLFGFLFVLVRLRHIMHSLSSFDPAHQHKAAHASLRIRGRLNHGRLLSSSASSTP